MTLEELCQKEVIQLSGGTDLGRIDDLEFDADTACVRALVLHGRARLFGLLGREEDLRIPWAQVEQIGADVVLVKTTLPAGKKRSPGGWLTQLFA